MELDYVLTDRLINAQPVKNDLLHKLDNNDQMTKLV
jgi:hypothetical protein